MLLPGGAESKSLSAAVASGYNPQRQTARPDMRIACTLSGAKERTAVSRAFVKETDEAFESLPDRPISKHPNLVTREGLEQIEATLTRLHQERALAQAANDGAMTHA
jgi:hypothetical protein